MTLDRELEEVLHAEREALLKGDFATLEALLPRKQSLAKRLSESKAELPLELYQSLKEKAVENDALLNSARRGLQAALTQFSDLKNGPEQTTYSRDGERRPMSQSKNSITQKI